MDGVFWYLDATCERQGPFEYPEIARLIRERTIRRETPIWLPGLNEWRQAADTQEFGGLFGGAVPASGPAAKPPIPLEGGPSGYRRPHGGSPSALVPDIPVGGLLGWGLLQLLGGLLFVPSPWTLAALYRFVASRITLPNGTVLGFAGKGGDIWYILLAPPFLELALKIGRLSFPELSLEIVYWPLLISVQAFSLVLQTYVYRWFCAKLTAADGRLSVSYKGDMLGLLVWDLLLILSAFTIIGWAWVFLARMRWVCRSVQGTHRFTTTATGGGILWRGFAAAIGSLLILPIPWVFRWITVWWISQISVVENID